MKYTALSRRLGWEHRSAFLASCSESVGRAAKIATEAGVGNGCAIEYSLNDHKFEA